MSYVMWFDRYEADLAPVVGGKCAVLGELTVVGFPVPPGFAVTTEAYRSACAPLPLGGAPRSAAALRELVEGVPLPDDVHAAVVGAYEKLSERCGTPDVPVAVRSSAVGEDAADASFAGEHDTYLWVRGAAEVVAVVRRCWASLFTERAVAYRHRLRRGGDGAEGPLMAVAVQQMVLAEAAGVAFTLNPQNGDRSEIAVEASWGLGEAVVGGEVTPDGYLVDKVLFEIVRRTVADKGVEYRPAPDGRGVVRRPVPPERRSVACLSDDQVCDVARLARRAEQHYGRPQDVEWAVEAAPDGGHRVVLLQSRPETVWSRRPATPVAAGAAPGYGSIVSTLVAGAAPARSGDPGLPGPFDVPVPPGAQGWEDLYTHSTLFSPGRRAYEESMFWFRDSVHWPTPLSPWDATLFEYAMATLSQYNTRHYLMPAARGVDYRILHGYAYLAPVAVADAAEIAARSAEFLARAGYYFRNWDDLYARWLSKVRALVARIEEVHFDPLPEKEDIAVITEGHGTGSGLALVQNYRGLLDMALTLWMHHFEFLNLGYAAYLDFFTFCTHAFPDIPDQSVARMVAGIEVDVFRPDDELKDLARLAVELDVDDVFADADRPDHVTGRLRGSAAGRRWLARWDEVADPWFHFSSGSGFYHTDRVWIEHREIPFGFVRDYAARVRRGEDLARPLKRLHEERDRITAEYAALLATDADRAAFDEKLGLARVVFPYVENHHFYVEHWAHATIWRKMRELGALLVGAGFLTAADDVFHLRRNEVTDVLWDLYSSWAVGAPAAGPSRWPEEIRRRRDILAALERQPPPPALGVPPEKVTEPFTIMLWGITDTSIGQWLGVGDDDPPGVLAGLAASPGVAEGVARVIASPAQLDQVREGEILVAPLTTPSWGPIFGRIRGAVTDVGGIMSHAAIVCREYGVPAVTGTATGTTRIRTGQRIRVDGEAGRVTILGDAPSDGPG